MGACTEEDQPGGSTIPQDAYSTMTKVIQAKWAFIQRLVAMPSSTFKTIEKLIQEELMPQLLPSNATNPFPKGL